MTVKMPGPVILCTLMPDDYRYGHVYGYTRDHMQTYADAVRREALEEAAERITTMPPPHHPNLNHAIEIGRGAREAYAHAIRALITQEAKT